MKIDVPAFQRFVQILSNIGYLGIILFILYNRPYDIKLRNRSNRKVTLQLPENEVVKIVLNCNHSLNKSALTQNQSLEHHPLK